MEPLSRVIILSEDVSTKSAGRIVEQIYKINEIDDEESNVKKSYERKPIQLIIHSYGGGANAMFAIISAITNSKTPVYTHIIGAAQSAGAKIAMCGIKGHRTASQWADIAIHDAYCHIEGKTVDLRNEMAQVELLNKKLKQLFVMYSNISAEMVDSFTESTKEVYLTLQEALAYGLIDEIIYHDPNK